MTHGTNYGYLKKKCRCPRCRAWAVAWFGEYRKIRWEQYGEVSSGSRGGMVPGKPCACNCGQGLPAASRRIYKNGHKPKQQEPSSERTRQ